MPGRLLLALALVGMCACRAAAQTESTDEGDLAVRYSLKSSLLWSRSPNDSVLFPDQNNGTGLWRFRVDPTWRWSDRSAFDAAFEQRLTLFTAPSSLAGTGVLPAIAPAPFRIRQLDWQLASGSQGEWRGEIDRAAFHLELSRAELTVGRQAIGWGRGALFGAVDLFAPFTPLEADREWRRGVDAVRADVKLADRVSLDTVAAFGETLNESAFVTRLRGFFGKMDAELVGGYRARDLLAGVTSSAAVGDFELHGECAAFRTAATPDSSLFHDPRLIGKAIAGGSYRLPVGNGVLVYGEYHFSGFGASSPDQILTSLRDPVFRDRYLRGDTQILGRHAVAVLASYEAAPEIALSGEWIFSPADGSGVAVPTVTWTLDDRWSLVCSLYLPHGREPIGATLGSEFGASPTALFVQLRVYR